MRTVLEEMKKKLRLVFDCSTEEMSLTGEREFIDTGEATHIAMFFYFVCIRWDIELRRLRNQFQQACAIGTTRIMT